MLRCTRKAFEKLFTNTLVLEPGSNSKLHSQTRMQKKSCTVYSKHLFFTQSFIIFSIYCGSTFSRESLVHSYLWNLIKNCFTSGAARNIFLQTSLHAIFSLYKFISKGGKTFLAYIQPVQTYTKTLAGKQLRVRVMCLTKKNQPFYVRSNFFLRGHEITLSINFLQTTKV